LDAEVARPGRKYLVTRVLHLGQLLAEWTGINDSLGRIVKGERANVQAEIEVLAKER